MPDTHDATTYTVNWTGMDGMEREDEIHGTLDAARQHCIYLEERGAQYVIASDDECHTVYPA